ERLLPVKTSTAEYFFRIWINNSTSIDRVISISKDSLEDFRGYLTEMGNLVRGKNSKQEYYRQIEIRPRSGFKVFKNKIDRLNLLNLSTPIDLIQLPLHQPFSTYVVEFKNHNEFNCFRFDTYYPYNGEINEKYAAVEKLIFDEFNLKQYFKFRK
ncbi:MAG: hypothetical protein Q8926_15770, partial [Bacteroidota bacterium]|nr:hypothetical protein [Bacteroidota bacterium]